MTNPLASSPALAHAGTLEPAAYAAVHWPAAYQPTGAAIVVRNELVIAAPVGTVWAWLLRAEGWPDWYSNSADIHFLSHAAPDLRDRSRFRWRTFGARVTSKVLEFVPPSDTHPARLGWNAHAIGLDAWHAWVLTPLAAGSTHVLTAEVQHGWRARLGRLLAPKRLETEHARWLESLSRQARTGPPSNA